MPPTSARPLETPPGSPSNTPPNSLRVYGSLPVDIIKRFEQAVEKLSQVFEKANVTTKYANAKPEVREHIKAKKLKTRAFKLEYKLIDEIYVPYSMVIIVLTSAVKVGYYYI